MKRKSVIKYLRNKFPKENWVAIKAGFGWIYRNKNDEVAWWVSVLSPRYDGDDDNFISRFYIYRKTGAQQVHFEDYYNINILE